MPTYKHSNAPSYKAVGAGQCAAQRGGGEPSHMYFHGMSGTCKQLCDHSPQCFGYSASKDNCLLWTQPLDLSKTGKQWGDASCNAKQD